jgi:hypothetical protein
MSERPVDKISRPVGEIVGREWQNGQAKILPESTKGAFAHITTADI